MAGHAVPREWTTGMVEVAAQVYAYVQATGETGISNAGLIILLATRPPWQYLQRFIPAFAREFPTLRLELPAVTFTDRMVLHDGDREIHLWHPGMPAHTVGDATVFLSDERVLFTGDITFHYVTLLALQAHVGNWIAAADRVLGFEADVMERLRGDPASHTCV